MRKLNPGELAEWRLYALTGGTVEPGYEYIEVDACCYFSNNHSNHSLCNPDYPDEKKSLEAQGWEHVWGPHLTNWGWKSIFRRPQCAR